MKRHSLFRSTSLVSVNRAISSLLGFMRDMIWARFFGANVSFNAFVIAYHLPSFISYMITEAGLTQAFIPMLAERQMKGDLQHAKRFIAQASTLLLFGLILIVVFSLFFSSGMIKIFAPGFSQTPPLQHLAVILFQIMCVGIFFSAIVSFASAILSTFGNYGISSSTQIICNVVVILFSVYFTSFFHEPIYAVAWGVLLSGVIQLCFFIPFLYQKNLLLIPRFDLKNAEIYNTIKLMMPALLNVTIMQMGVFVDFIFSSYLSGGIGWLYYSSRLMELPINIIGTGIVAVILPNLSRSFASQDMITYKQSLDWAIRVIFFIGIPAGIVLFLLSGPIITTLFSHGVFTSHDVLMTQKSTKAFAAGIVGGMLFKICATAFYAAQNTRTPVKIVGIMLLIKILLNFLLFGQLAHVGLALSTVVSGFIGAILLFFLLIKKQYYDFHADLFSFLYKIILSVIAVSIFLYDTTPHLSVWLQASIVWQILHLLLELSMSIMLYGAVLYLMGFPFHVFRKKFDGVFAIG